MSLVVVTGASGQLGSALVRRLTAEGERVRVVLRQGAEHRLLPIEHVEVVRGSFLDRAVLERAMAGADAVVHAAGLVSYAARDDRAIYRVNVEGTAAVFDEALRAGVADFVHVSSTMAVGPRAGGEPATEDDPFPPELYRVPYADSKRLAERYVLAGAHRGAKVVSVCPSTITGRGERLGNFERLFRLARRAPLVVAPPGVSAVVDVDDVVEGLLRAWRRGATGRRYVLSSQDATFAEVFRAINRALGHDIEPVVVPRPPLAALARVLSLAAEAGTPVQGASRGLAVLSGVRRFSAERARRELGWAPSVGLDESMARALAYFETHLW